jgi:septum site-determining protein MinD
VKIHLLLTRYDSERVDQGEMLRTEDVLEILAIPLLGVIPQDRAVLAASNVGTPIVLDERSTAGQAYRDAVRRLMGEEVPMRFAERNRGGWFQRLLRRTA